MRNSRRSTLERDSVRFWCCTCKEKRCYKLSEIGRANWQFSDSHRHGHCNGAIYTIVNNRRVLVKFVNISTK